MKNKALIYRKDAKRELKGWYEFAVNNRLIFENKVANRWQCSYDQASALKTIIDKVGEDAYGKGVIDAEERMGNVLCEIISKMIIDQVIDENILERYFPYEVGRYKDDKRRIEDYNKELNKRLAKQNNANQESKRLQDLAYDRFLKNKEG